jgi:hypothetical protein
MFEDNDLPCTKAEDLFNLWKGAGLNGTLGLQCRQCNRQPHQSQPSAIDNLLCEKSVISFIDGSPPAHLYFHLDAVSLSDNDQKTFAAEMEWPFKLNFGGHQCTLILRGFWGDSHYWGKVLRHMNGVTGVWMHKDQANGGFSQLINRVPGSISGAQDNTSWLIYSRRWTAEEDTYINKSINNIVQDNPKVAVNHIPFVNMGAVINSTFNSALPHITQMATTIKTSKATKEAVGVTIKLTAPDNNDIEIQEEEGKSKCM